MTCGKLSSQAPSVNVRPSSFRLQFCHVTTGVTEWFECSRHSHLFYAVSMRSLTSGSSQTLHRGEAQCNGETGQDKLMMMIIMMMIMMMMIMMILLLVMMMMMIVLMIMVMLTMVKLIIDLVLLMISCC